MTRENQRDLMTVEKVLPRKATQPDARIDATTHRSRRRRNRVERKLLHRFIVANCAERRAWVTVSGFFDDDWFFPREIAIEILSEPSGLRVRRR